MRPYDFETRQRVGRRLLTLAYGYQTHQAAMEVALNPQVLKFLRCNPELINDVGEIPRLGDKGWQYSKTAWLGHQDFIAVLEEDFAIAWLSGALINAGDLLSQHRYFDRHPMLEMIRYLRNAIAHGNRFRIDSAHKLQAHPANNRGAEFQGWDGPRFFEIRPELDGTKFLFEYMAPGNVVDIIASCGTYLQKVPSKP